MPKRNPPAPRPRTWMEMLADRLLEENERLAAERATEGQGQGPAARDSKPDEPCQGDVTP